MQLWQRLRRPLADLVLLLMLIAAGGAVGVSVARLGEWAVTTL